MRPEPEQLSSVLYRPMLNLRGDVMPLMPLWEATGESPAAASARAANGRSSNGRSPGGTGRYAVVVEGPTGRWRVDDLIDQHEIVVKSLSSFLGRTRGIAGATIMGDGQVVLIVDVPTRSSARCVARRSPPGPSSMW